MKKILVTLFTACLIILGSDIFAQHTPQQIADICKQYNEQSRRDEPDELFDTLYAQINRYISDCDNLLKTSNSRELYAERAIWKNLLAQVETSYFKQYTYKIQRRTTTAIEPKDAQTWTADWLVINILRNNWEAINDARAANLPIDDYTALCDTTKSVTFFPTLFDFIANNFDGHLAGLENSSALTTPQNPFVPQWESYFEDHFFTRTLTSSDTLSIKFNRLRIYQELDKYHQSNGNYAAQMMVHLKLYDWISNTKQKSQEEYMAALHRDLKKFDGKPGCWLLYISLGDLYTNRASGETSQPNDYVSAIQWYEKALKVIPASETKQMKDCQTSIDNIQKPDVRLHSEEMIYPEPTLYRIVSRNCDKIYVYLNRLPKDLSTIKNYIPLNIAYDTIITISKSDKYLNDSIIMMLPQQRPGKYLFIASTKPISGKSLKNAVFEGSDCATITVSTLGYTKIADRTKMDIWVTDRKTGEPISNAKVTFYHHNYKDETKNLVTTLVSDAKGHVHINISNFYSSSRDYSNHTFDIEKGNDALRDNECYFYIPWNSNTYEIEYRGYTDRKIYRPGQTVKWKAIAVKQNDNDSKLVPQAKVIVEIKDANYQLIKKDTLKTNEFGSIAGEFTIPKSGALGNYRIIFKNLRDEDWNQISFKVEEYKRPTFDITIGQPEDTYRTGEVVRVNGNAQAYAGYPVQNAQVTYHIQRKTYFPFYFYGWWRNPYRNGNTQEISDGVCTTDEDGHFTFNFTALKDEASNRWGAAYLYTVTVKVTDVSGETHESSTRIHVSDKAWRFNIRLPEWLCCDRDGYTFPLSVVNLNDKVQNAQVSYRVVELDMPQQFLLPAPFTSTSAAEKYGHLFPQFAFNHENECYSWKEKAEIATGKFNTEKEKELAIPQLKDCSSGAYKLILTTTDPYGEKLEEEFFFYLSQNENSAFPAYTPLHLTANKSTAKIGDTVTFTISSYLENAYALVCVSSNNKILECKWITLHKSSQTLSYVVKEGQQGSISCQVQLSYNNKIYRESSSVEIPFSNKKIDFEFITFRNKLEPGEKSSVKLRLNDEFQKPLTQAELLCSMYDASLDAFSSNSYALYLNNTNYDDAHSLISFQPYTNKYYGTFFIWNQTCDYAFFTAPQWNSNFAFLPRYHNRYNSRPMYATKAANPAIMYDRNSAFEPDLTYTVFEEVEVEEMASFSDANNAANVTYAWKQGIIEESKPEPATTVTPRTNFAETAFFYPFLRTNEQGEIEMEFTIPESLTEWKMLGLAHTLDLRVGTFEKRIQTQKQLMVVSNAPRFVYENDRLDFSAKVVSMSDLPMGGTATLQLFNAESNEEIFSQQTTLLLAPGATEPVTFSIDVPIGVSAITYRFTAQCRDGYATFTDGEENTLPVLSRRVIVSESVPIFITKKGDKNFPLNGLDNNNNSLISCHLLFTPNPKWNVVLALPYLTEYPYDCSEQLFSKLYANLLSSYILQQNPNLEKLLNDCRDNHPEALQSKLRQNEDLMQILLTETPWVFDAQNQEQDIQDIFCLFDRKRMAAEMKSMVNKLENNQNSDGGWPWFRGGRSSLYITNHLLIGAGRLMERGVCQTGNNFLKKSTLTNAVKFADNKVESDFKKMKREYPDDLKNFKMGSGTLHYLYARSFFMSENNSRESYRFYEKKLYEQAMSLPTFYQKTLAALTLYRWNTTESKALAKKLMEEVKKYAKHSEEMGMYWKKEGYGYYWDDAVIERQALMMEAFDLILNDKESVREMEIWLLQQRRTNHWETTRATAEACYAVFCNGTETSKTTPGNITLTMGDVTRRYTDTLQIPVKEDVTEALASSQAATAVLSRDNDGLAYGGLIYKYWTDIDSVTSTGTDIPLSVERQLYRVDLGERGETLTLVTDENPLHVGDKVRVRMEIRADRDLEYIHLKDLRAAAFEPAETLSGYRWQDGLGYYQSFRDASVNFFFDNLNRGTYVFEYTMFVTQSGTFSSGYASIQCMYAPEFNAHSANNGKIFIEKKNK